MLYTPEQIEAMREWLKDISFRDIEPEDIDELTDSEVIKGVEAHFEGGATEFMQTL